MDTNAISEAKPKFSERVRGVSQRITNLRLVDRRLAVDQQVDIVGDKAFMELLAKCEPYTMTSKERMYALYNAATYVATNKIPGDVVETGVWRGGSSMMSALTLLANDDRERDLWLYDTYEGMTEPTEADRSWDGRSAQDQYDAIPDWCAASLDDVRTNMLSTGYPEQKLHFIEGKVEDTIPQAGVPEQIALLRLDTDWYVSNKHELENLYPRLVSGGVLVIDDYGHWEGVRRSVDEYFAANEIKGLFTRIDYTGRMMIKP